MEMPLSLMPSTGCTSWILATTGRSRSGGGRLHSTANCSGSVITRAPFSRGSASESHGGNAWRSSNSCLAEKYSLERWMDGGGESRIDGATDGKEEEEEGGGGGEEEERGYDADESGWRIAGEAGDEDGEGDVEAEEAEEAEEEIGRGRVGVEETASISRKSCGRLSDSTKKTAKVVGFDEDGDEARGVPEETTVAAEVQGAESLMRRRSPSSTLQRVVLPTLGSPTTEMATWARG